jgi:hypothetical protein
MKAEEKGKSEKGEGRRVKEEDGRQKVDSDDFNSSFILPPSSLIWA